MRTRSLFPLVGLGIAALALTSCAALGGSSPERVAQEYLDAMAAGDMDTVLEFAVDPETHTRADTSYDIFTAAPEQVTGSLTTPISNIEIGKAERGEGAATVPTSFNIGDERYDLELTLRESEEGGFKVTNRIPVFYPMNFGTQDFSVRGFDLMMGGIEVDELEALRVPYGEFTFAAEADAWAIASSDAEQMLLMTPGVEDLRGDKNQQDNEYNRSTTGDFVLSDDLYDAIPAILKACEEEPDSFGNHRTCPTGEPVNISVQVGTSFDSNVEFEFEPANSWTDPRRPDNGPMTRVSATVDENGELFSVSLSS
ncbi:hypothetical protein ACXR2T_08090 [Leucobacter sp. HY1910]